MAICSRGGGLAALRETQPAGRRLVRYCSVCGAVVTIFSGLAAKEDFTVSFGYRPTTIADLKFNKVNKHGALVLGFASGSEMTASELVFYHVHRRHPAPWRRS
jgi:hypothetical protein